MIRSPFRVTPVIGALLLATASAQQPAAPASFRFERPVVTGGAGPRRLAIDVPLLVGGKPFQVVSGQTHDPTAIRSALLLSRSFFVIRCVSSGCTPRSSSGTPRWVPDRMTLRIATRNDAPFGKAENGLFGPGST